MKQPQYQPLAVWEMALTLFAVNNGYFDNVEVAKALAAEKALRDFARSKYSVLVDEVERDKKFSKDVEAKLHELVKDFKKTGSY
jgi:F-type H+-transporting ATPase subunit alpha